MVTNSLQELLLRDWGTDLPIRGGFGQSREDPIIVDSSDPTRAVEIQMLVLRGLGRGRGIFWRCVQRSALRDKWPGIEQFKIETVELTDNEIITQTENYYFDLSALKCSRAPSAHPTHIVHSDKGGLALPYELGWLHFNDSIDNEVVAPGLGVTLRYGAPGIKGTVYIYDRGRNDIPEDVNDPWIWAEFEGAAADIATVHSDLAPWPDPLPNGAYHIRYYALGDSAQEATVLWMSAARGKLVKARATWERDHFLDKVGNGFLKALLVCVGRSN